MNKQEALKELVDAEGSWRNKYANNNSHLPDVQRIIDAYDAYLAAKDEKCPFCDIERGGTIEITYENPGPEHEHTSTVFYKFCPICGRRFDAPNKVSPPKIEKCPHCDINRKVFDGHKFCGWCGRPFDTPEKVSPPKITESGHCDDPQLKKPAIEPRLSDIRDSISAMNMITPIPQYCLLRVVDEVSQIIAWIEAHVKEGR